MNCSFCGGVFDAFLEYGVPPRPGRCPACGAKGRHRALALFARERLFPRLGAGKEILEIGPTHSIVDRVAAFWSGSGARYTAVDIRTPKRAAKLSAPSRFLEMDARALRLPDASCDLVLCSNVLSFVAEDLKIVSEARRVLKLEGLAILTVHRIEGPSLSAADYARLNPEATEEFLAENGSAWFYGDDYGERLAGCGLVSRDIRRPVTLDPEGELRLGLERQPTLTLAAKDRQTLEAWLS